MFTREWITHILELSTEDDYINVNKVNQYANELSSDRRFKLKWLARDFYKKGCSSGILSYHGCEYYFSLSGTILKVGFN